MDNVEYLVILVTTPSIDEAQAITQLLLEQRRAACVNIIPKVSSSFWWRNRIDSATENLLIIKSKASQLQEIINLIKESHSYEVPEIIALPIINGNRAYLDWLDSSLASG